MVQEGDLIIPGTVKAVWSLVNVPSDGTIDPSGAAMGDGRAGTWVGR